MEFSRTTGERKASMKELLLSRLATEYKSRGSAPIRTESIKEVDTAIEKFIESEWSDGIDGVKLK
jgi:hypothetical protein